MVSSVQPHLDGVVGSTPNPPPPRRPSSPSPQEASALAAAALLLRRYTDRHDFVAGVHVTAPGADSRPIPLSASPSIEV